MAEVLVDGSGTGYRAKVNSSNRLLTASVTLSELEDGVKKGRAYNINTGEITLTSDAETPIIYIKNNEDYDLHVNTMIVGVGTSTGGSATEQCKVTMVANPDAGTIISGATAVDITSNRNFGSRRELDADSYKGATGLTMTGGEDHIFSYQKAFDRSTYILAEIVPKDSSLGVKIQPPTGNTSMTVYVAVVLHVEDE